MSDLRKDRPASSRRADAADPADPTGAGKGRPTPKRKVSQQANKRPLVPADRRAAYKANRAKQREARARTNQAMLTGDERYLPARDRGPVRRYVRSVVDARWNLAEFFLPASLLIVLVVLFAGDRPVFALVAIVSIYVFVLAAVVDTFIMSRSVKRRVLAKFGEVPRGTLMYAAMRAFQMRRTRLPRPTVKRGERPA